MELPKPEQHIGYQEILHLGLTVVEDLGPPVRMRAQTGIRMLKYALSVKFRKPERIRGKMGGHPVQDHAYS